MDTNVTILAVYEYWDSMDGDAMVCSQFGPQEYRTMCNFNQYVLGIVFTLQGLWLLFNAKRMGRLQSIVLPINSTTTSFQKRNLSQQQQARSKAQKSFFKRLTYALGFEFLAYGVTHLLDGHGIIYASSTKVGTLSHVVLSVRTAWSLYYSLLQLRGAEAFRTLVQLPVGAGGDGQKREGITRAIDILQGICAFPIAFGFVVLLVSNVITRPTLYAALNIMMGCAGVRSLIENIFDRARTLVRINELQQSAGGDIEAIRRRRNILRKKVRALIMHMLGIVVLNMLLPFSLVIFGSVNSSTQMLIHQGADHTLFAFAISIMCVLTHKRVNKSYAEQNVHMNLMTMKVRHSITMSNEAHRQFTVADVSGMSVVCPSEIAAGDKTSVEKSSGVGLFSEIESYV